LASAAQKQTNGKAKQKQQQLQKNNINSSKAERVSQGEADPTYKQAAVVNHVLAIEPDYQMQQYIRGMTVSVRPSPKIGSTGKTTLEQD